MGTGDWLPHEGFLSSIVVVHMAKNILHLVGNALRFQACVVVLQVADVYFPKDRVLNRRKNFCFVTFATQQVSHSFKQVHMSFQCNHAIPTWMFFPNVYLLTVETNSHLKMCCGGCCQAAEKAAAQSNREISGYRIESISLTQERQVHYIRKQGLPAMGAGEEALPEFEYAQDFGQQWAVAGGQGFSGGFQGLGGQLGSAMPGAYMQMVRAPNLPVVCTGMMQFCDFESWRCWVGLVQSASAGQPRTAKGFHDASMMLLQGAGSMQQGGLGMQPGWGSLEAQQALLQSGQAMGMGLAASGLGEGAAIQVRSICLILLCGRDTGAVPIAGTPVGKGAARKLQDNPVTFVLSVLADSPGLCPGGPDHGIWVCARPGHKCPAG